MTDAHSKQKTMGRRAFLAASVSLVALAALPEQAVAEPEDADEAIRQIFGSRRLNEGRVTAKLPPIAENGNSVQLNISVDSPMTQVNHVRQIAIFSPRNPIALIAQFKLGPQSGRAEISTRVRLAGSQTLRVVAEMSDGTLWQARTSTYVTLAACVIG